MSSVVVPSPGLESPDGGEKLQFVVRTAPLFGGRDSKQLGPDPSLHSCKDATDGARRTVDCGDEWLGLDRRGVTGAAVLT